MRPIYCGLSSWDVESSWRAARIVRAGASCTLESRPGVAALFAPYSKNIADRFSYSLVLDSSASLSPLTSALPLYFRDALVALAFVPDRPLATDIFAAVAQASRSLSQPLNQKTVFEGQLTLRGAEPSFEVLEIRSGTAHSSVWEQEVKGRAKPCALVKADVRSDAQCEGCFFGKTGPRTAF